MEKAICRGSRDAREREKIPRYQIAAFSSGLYSLVTATGL
ncbi:hypothetical protein A2U01_0105778, partial [Trifolium medium]|nr:hypothetical protein [Trifolium medium]